MFVVEGQSSHSSHSHKTHPLTYTPYQAAHPSPYPEDILILVIRKTHNFTTMTTKTSAANDDYVGSNVLPLGGTNLPRGNRKRKAKADPVSLSTDTFHLEDKSGSTELSAISGCDKLATPLLGAQNGKVLSSYSLLQPLAPEAGGEEGSKIIKLSDLPSTASTLDLAGTIIMTLGSSGKHHSLSTIDGQWKERQTSVTLALFPSILGQTSRMYEVNERYDEKMPFASPAMKRQKAVDLPKSTRVLPRCLYNRYDEEDPFNRALKERCVTVQTPVYCSAAQS